MPGAAKQAVEPIYAVDDVHTPPCRYENPIPWRLAWCDSKAAGQPAQTANRIVLGRYSGISVLPSLAR